ncbi:MAG TPA: AarF/ABC1/UbiB kinase family protein [Myxococcales bacterium]|jgi:predicted unusual protein kinase regulating ubiquinone biosynthesis (AarF/ABC1/UbiB family)
MSKDPVQELLESLARQEGAEIPTTALGRLRRTAAAGARVGLGAVAGRLRGGELNLGSLSPEALSKLAQSFGQLKGVAMKVGQILSYVDGSLDPQARQMLAVLQAHSQPTPFAQIEEIVRVDLGSRAPALLSRLGRTPVATASIGQVHRASREDGTPVAVKVRHPGIEEAIRADFKAASVGKAMARAFAPGIDVAEVIGEAQERFLEECDYALEARRQQRFAGLFAGHALIRIPAVHADWCGPRVLTTSWAEGAGLEAFLASSAPGEVRERASRTLYEFYVGALYRHGLFNADPHPGNVLFAPDGSATVLDHGCVREFERPLVDALVRLSRAVRRDDATQIQVALSSLGMPEPDRNFEATRALLRGFYEPLLTPGRHAVAPDRSVSMGQQVQLKQKLMKMRLPGKLMFLFRIRFGLYAVLARLGAELDWAALEDELAGGAG